MSADTAAVKFIPLTRALAGIAALTPVTAGLFALVAWDAGRWQLASLGSGYIPMAPLSAILFVVLGLALALQVFQPAARAARLTGMTASVLTLATCALVALQSTHSFALPWDRWLLGQPANVGTFPVGRMSPLTVLAFLCTAVALLGQSSPPAGPLASHRLACYPAAAGLIIGNVVAIGYAVGTPPLYSGTIVPMALLTALAFIALNGGLLLVGRVDKLLRDWQTSDPAPHVPAEHRTFTRRLVMVVALIGVLIILAGGIYLRRQQADARRMVHVQLDAIARLKAEEISQWRRERLGEARFLNHSSTVARDAATLVAQPDDPSARQRFADWLESIQGGERYQSALVFDAQARLLMAIPDPAGPAALITPGQFAAALASPEPLMIDLHRDGDSAIHLSLLVPIRPPAAPEVPASSITPIVVVALQLDPQQFLYPLIRNWPVPSASAESMLVRREGEEVVYLSELRHRPNAALALRQSIHATSLPAAMALRGEVGLHEGYDYRGIRVLSMSRPIPDSPWVLVAKIDQAEAYEAIRRDAWQTGLMVAFLLLAVALAGAAFWRERHTSFLRRALAAEQERKLMAERLDLVMRHAHDVILVFDDNMRIVDANERALAAYGYSAAEIRQLTVRDLRTPAHQGTAPADFAQTLHSNGTIFEVVHRRRDGTDFPVEVSSRPFEAGGRRQVLAIIRDITERKANEREIKRLNRMYFVVSQVNQAVVRAKSRTGLLPEICRILVEFGQFKIAWIGWHDPATHLVDPVAVAGDVHGYVARIRISSDPGVPEGQGPSGSAFRGGRIYVCNDFLADPATQPWQEHARLVGFQSSIALPLRQEGTVVGLLTVYAAEKDFFGPEEIKLLDEAAGDLSFAFDVLAGQERRRVAEEENRRNEQRLRIIFEQSPIGIAVVDSSNGHLDECNAGFAAITGRTREELIEMDWMSITHPADVQQDLDNMARMNAGEITGFKMNKRYLRPDGSIVWISMTIARLRTDGSDRRQHLCLIEDITDRRQAEAALRVNAERYEAITSTTTDACWEVGSNGRILAVNEGCCRLYGFSRDELLARSVQDFEAIRNPAETNVHIREIMSTGYARFETRHRGQGGRIIEVEVSTTYQSSTGTFLAFIRDLTERKRAEAALNQASTYNRSLIEASLDPLVTIGTDGRITDVNAATEAATGCTREQLVGSDFSDYFTEPAKARAGYQQVFRDGFVRDYALELRHRDGRVATVLYNASVYRDPQGRVTGVFAAARDITERKRAEVQLQKLSQAVEQSPALIIITDLTGTIEYVNPWFTTLTGFASAEVLGRNPRLLQSGRTLPGTYAEIWRTITSGGTWRGELIDRKKNGELFTALAVIAPVLGPDGRVSHYVAIENDITESKRLEAVARETLQRFNVELEQKVEQRTLELAVSEERMRLVLQASSIGTFEVDLASGAGSWNSVEFELLGLKPGDVPGNPESFFRFVHPDDVGALRTRWAEALRTGEFEAEFRVVRADGQERWLAGKGRFAFEGERRQQAVRFMGVNYDITARKRLEVETAAMLEREREVSEMKSRFISVTSHEFRTPMTAIMGSVELLANHLEQFAPAKRAQLFERINSSLHRMNQMLDDVLTLNRLDASRTAVRLEPVDLQPFVANVVEEIRLGDRDAHRFAIEPAGAAAAFVTDPRLFHHVLSNLLGNAVRYSPAGTVVTVRLGCDAGRVRLTVEDRGIGIPPADRARIFEPFERGSNVGGIKGTGLGLNIVKRMTELLGGTVTHDPLPAGGSRFTLVLPLLGPPSATP